MRIDLRQLSPATQQRSQLSGGLTIRFWISALERVIAVQCGSLEKSI